MMGADPLTAGLLVGGSILSGSQQRKAAKKAASAQQSGADQSIELQRQALEQSRMASEPFRFGGQQAINPLLASLGLQGFSMPTQPIFDLHTGQPTTDPAGQSRIEEINARLAELRNRRG